MRVGVPNDTATAVLLLGAVKGDSQGLITLTTILSMFYYSVVYNYCYILSRVGQKIILALSSFVSYWYIKKIGIRRDTKSSLLIRDRVWNLKAIYYKS